MTHKPGSSIRPIDVDSLPAVSSAGPSVGRALPWLGVPRTCQLPGVGAVALSFVALGDRKAAEGSGDATLALHGEDDGQVARLSFDPHLALSLVSIAIGRKAPSVLRRLGRTEHGILAAHVAHVLQAMGSSWRVSLRAPPPAMRGESLIFLIEVSAPNQLTGRARLEVPRVWVDEPASPLTIEQAARVPCLAVIELATTTLVAREKQAVTVGDAVVFDGVSFASASLAWSVRVAVGSFAASARVDADGSVRVLDGFRSVPTASGHHWRSGKDLMSDGAETKAGATIDATAVLASAPVEIVAELGRLQLRGDELLSLARGGVIAFPGLRTSAVALRVGGEIWARGQLVDVDGELGVRISELCGVQSG